MVPLLSSLRLVSRAAISLALSSSARAHPVFSSSGIRTLSSTSARAAEGDADVEVNTQTLVPPVPGQVTHELNQGNQTTSTHFELGRCRRVTVAEWNGKPQIGVREWYPNPYTGELRPGPRGVALTVEEWKTLLASSSEINRLVDVKEAELDQRAEGEQEVVREREEEKLREKRGEERATV